jgi:hypothetical protein
MFKNPNEAIQKFAIANSQKVLIVDSSGFIIKSNADLLGASIDEVIETSLAVN